MIVRLIGMVGIVLSFFAFCVFSPTAPAQSRNNAPVVKIVAPKNNSTFSTNSLIPYSITVSDREDGESKYDEIASDKIFLEIKFVEDAGDSSDASKLFPDTEPEGLTLMKNSDCFTCHQFASVLVGPSFRDIAMRYPEDSQEKTRVASRITNGSKSLWGQAVMPAHPDISPEAAAKIATWIIRHGASQTLNYIAGKEGSFRLTTPPGAQGGFFALRASYTDKGIQGAEKLSSQDVVTIRYKQ
jgi:cytochrome c